MSRGLNDWLRWVSVLPAGLVAIVGVTIPLHLAILLLYHFGGSPDGFVTETTDAEEVRGCALLGLTCFISAETMERLGMAFTSPFFFIFAGALAAPGRRMIVGIILAIAFALGLGSMYTLAFTADPQYGLRGWGTLHWGATPILDLLGLGGALVMVWQKWARHTGYVGVQQP